jgi:hypothetical protein
MSLPTMLRKPGRWDTRRRMLFHCEHRYFSRKSTCGTKVQMVGRLVEEQQRWRHGPARGRERFASSCAPPLNAWLAWPASRDRTLSPRGSWRRARASCEPPWRLCRSYTSHRRASCCCSCQDRRQPRGSLRPCRLPLTTGSFAGRPRPQAGRL